MPSFTYTCPCGTPHTVAGDGAAHGGDVLLHTCTDCRRPNEVREGRVLNLPPPLYFDYFSTHCLNCDAVFPRTADVLAFACDLLPVGILCWTCYAATPTFTPKVVQRLQHRIAECQATLRAGNGNQ